MSVTVKLATPFREVTGGKGQVVGEGASIKEVLDNLQAQYPGFRDMVFDESGEFHRHAHLFVNGEDFHALGGLYASLKEGDEVSVLFALSGG